MGAADKPSVRVVEGTWQARLPELGTFDCVFFDDFGLPGFADREMDRCPKADYRDEYEETFRQDGGSHFEAFVRIVLGWHSRKGSRLSGFIMHMLQSLEDADIESLYRYVKVSPPPHCNYFFSNRALAPLFVKRSDPAATSEIGIASTRSGSPASRNSACDSEDSGPEGVGCESCGASRSRSRSPRRASLKNSSVAITLRMPAELLC